MCFLKFQPEDMVNLCLNFLWISNYIYLYILKRVYCWKKPTISLFDSTWGWDFCKHGVWTEK